MLLVAVGQPLFAEDTWWHLAMGEAYAASGPWLQADPLLFTALAPPAPAAWLADLALHGVERAGGFQALRVVHVVAVAGILGLAWSALRRASGSPAFASLATGLFAVLSAYRLFQLRPHLLSMLAALLLVRLLIQCDGVPSWRRVAAAVALLALWANSHAGFLLGPALLAAAVGGLTIAALQSHRHPADAPRARRLTAALGLGLLATLVNPAGARQHLLYFTAGSETPALGVVADEWAGPNLLELPVANLPPSPLAWAAVWLLLVVTPCAALLHWRRLRREASVSHGVGSASLDPALAAVAAAALVLLSSAVRFLWLGIFPLLFVGQSARALGWLAGTGAFGFRRIAALAAVLLLPGFVWLGDWPMISQGVRRAWYARPYPAFKSHAHAVWQLRDAALEGNLFNDYSSGNFLGYWLAPRMRVFVNGSLNVPPDVMAARGAIVARRGLEAGESFLELLDRYRVDVFFGTGLPSLGVPNRRVISTTTHLEGAAGWIPAFRNLRSAIYVRKNDRNRPNLQRLVAHYSDQRVPFDPERGFDPERVLREAPHWAVRHGLAPAGFERLEARARSPNPRDRALALDRLAELYAVLGLYERSAAIDRGLVRANPPPVAAARRLAWSLLHQRRLPEALESAEQLEAVAAAHDGLSQLLVDTLRRYAELREEGDEERASALVALLPLLTREQQGRVLAGFQQPEARARASERPAENAVDARARSGDTERPADGARPGSTGTVASSTVLARKL